MGAVATLAEVSLEPKPGVRYFSAHGCVEHREQMRLVFVGGSLIGTFHVDDPVKRDLLIVTVCEDPAVRYGRVADAFEVSAETVRRIRRRNEEGGLKALLKSHRRGRKHKVDTKLTRELERLFDAGATVTEAFERIEQRVCRGVVGRVRKQWTTRQVEQVADGTPHDDNV